MQCRNCGRELEGGEYCPWCGAHQTVSRERHVTRRPHVYAANPSEHVLQPSIVSTLFPHMGARRMFQLGWLLLVAVIAVVAISLGRLVPLAIVLSALLLPVRFSIEVKATTVPAAPPMVPLL